MVAPTRACVGLVAVLAACCSGERPSLLVFAAASVSDVVVKLAEESEARGDGRVSVSAGASVALQRQIEAGAPADLFISAASDPVDALIRDGRAAAADRVDLLANRLVLAVRIDASEVPAAAQDLRHVKRLAIGDPDFVPAGRYAQAALRHLGMWEALQPRLLLAVDVRAALAYVVSGAADAGIVYATDATVFPSLKVAWTFPESSHPPIRYTAVVIGGSGREAEARRFLTLLASPVGRERFQRAGFVPLSRSGAGD